MSSIDSDSPDRSVIEIAAGVCLAVFSGALLVWIIPANVGHTASEHDISPDFFPRLAAWALLGLALWLIADRWVKAGNLRHAIARSIGGTALVAEVAVWLIVAILAWLGMAYLSFLATSSALIAVGAIACGYRNLWVLAGVALALPVVVAQIAWHVFEVRLP